MLTIAEEKTNALVIPTHQGSVSAIYAPHFGLHKHPFAQIADRQFYFVYKSIEQVVNTVFYSLHSGEGIVKITGETGSGKTNLVRNIVGSLKGDFFVVSILNHQLTSKALLQAIIDEFAVSYPADANPQQLTRILQNLLFEHYARTHTKVLLCIDDAQKLPVETLDMLHVISNLETSKRKLVQIILVGTSALDEKLNHPRLFNVKQRIAFTEELKPLDKRETREYITFRLQRAGLEENGIFSQATVDAVFHASKGLPRVINTIAHKAMMLAFGEGKPRVQESHIKAAVEDTDFIFREPLALPWYCVTPFFLALLGSAVLFMMSRGWL